LIRFRLESNPEQARGWSNPAPSFFSSRHIIWEVASGWEAEISATLRIHRSEINSMSRTLTISDALFQELEEEARERGLDRVESLLEQRKSGEDEQRPLD
jgi:hypothetical protein